MPTQKASLEVASVIDVLQEMLVAVAALGVAVLGVGVEAQPFRKPPKSPRKPPTPR